MTQLAGLADEPNMKDAEILLKDGDWTIEKLRPMHETPGFRTSRSRFYSLLKHVCYPDRLPPYQRPDVGHVHQVVVYADDSEHCWRCTKPIPDGMVAVWKFQNWKELAYGG
jgi:hypothetical protein